MKVITVMGARPQFIKAWPVSQALAQVGISEVIVHTGQHYDHLMSEVFFKELNLPAPHLNLEVGSGGHAAQTALIMERLEPVILTHKPDAVLVYGDTNSTLAAAIVSAKLHVPIVHVEAGLRSFNRRMPEEINRVLTDHCSTLLLCPTPTAVDYLRKEGITNGVHLIGDVMHEAVLSARERAGGFAPIPGAAECRSKGYFLATVHRAENTDNAGSLREIFQGLSQLPQPVVLPAHPRLRSMCQRHGIDLATPNVLFVNPLGYVDMVRAVTHARAVLTDSGGLQKEALWLGVPCITLRAETEWVETLRNGANQLVGADAARIVSAAKRLPASVEFHDLPSPRPSLACASLVKTITGPR